MAQLALLAGAVLPVGGVQVDGDDPGAAACAAAAAPRPVRPPVAG